MSKLEVKKNIHIDHCTHDVYFPFQFIFLVHSSTNDTYKHALMDCSTTDRKGCREEREREQDGRENWRKERLKKLLE